MKILLTILATAVISMGGAFFMMQRFLAEYEQKLGATITTLNATDRLSDSRPTINTNFTNLNSDKIEVGTTSVGNITALPNQITTGTLTTGTWNASVIQPAYGGTGSSTLSQFRVLLGSTTNAIGIVNGVGTSGQTLQSQGNNLPPVWAANNADQSANYTWTGLHTFTASSTFSDATTTFNGIALGFPANYPSNMASGTALVVATTSSSRAQLQFVPIATSTRGVLGSVTSLIGVNALGINASSSIISVMSTTTKSSPANAVYTKLKSIRVGLTGVYTTCFTFGPPSDSQTVFARIYVDDVAVGTERSHSSGGVFQTHCENINAPMYSEIQVYGKGNAAPAETSTVKWFSVNYIPSNYPIITLE